MYSVAKTLALLCLNIGWLIPAYFSMSWLIRWCDVEAAPVIYGTELQMNSFPFLHASRQMLVIATVWLGVAIAVNTFRPPRAERTE